MGVSIGYIFILYIHIYIYIYTKLGDNTADPLWDPPANTHKRLQATVAAQQRPIAALRLQGLRALCGFPELNLSRYYVLTPKSQYV